jgi:hypothetical protein
MYFPFSAYLAPLRHKGQQQLFNQDTLRVNFDWTFNQILDFLRETGIWNKMVWQV